VETGGPPSRVGGVRHTGRGQRRDNPPRITSERRAAVRTLFRPQGIARFAMWAIHSRTLRLHCRAKQVMSFWQRNQACGWRERAGITMD
jgi:hypothetical protein